MRNYLTRRNSDEDFGLSLFRDVFDNFFTDTPFFNTGVSAMRTDIKTTDNGYELSIDMPGFEKKDIELSLSDGYLTVKANTQSNENDKYIRRERSVSCSRSYYVGDNITEEDVKAKYDKGILSIEIPKKEQKALPKKNINID